ncbi:MAG TPA: sigma-70 family RNA polymerase sigma factor [Gemmataceae bacterium]|nr:sigma-70 family RNA polymerase sigma factor [Gemmataceae bacterium]
MPQSSLAAIVGRLVRGLPPTDGTADDALLARFVGWRDEAAFELLVYRHGPMVRGLCRRILRHEQDAEDAFQATFLALAKKAGSIHGRSLAGWLYRVAFHAALKARGKRVACPLLWVGMSPEQPMPTQSGGHGTPEDVVEAGELAAALDEEILRLPERFRLPVVLCYLQGRSNSEAAAALAIPKGTVDSRLSTARQRLRVRLLRRGFAPAIAAAAVEGALDAGELPGSVARAVTKAAVAFISKQAGVPAAAAVLAEGVLETMYLTKFKWAMAAAITVALLGGGAGVATYGVMAGDGPPIKAAEEKREPPDQPPASQGKEAPAKPPGVATAPSTTRGYEAICEALQKETNLEKSVEGSPLKDVLEFLADYYHLTFIVDTQAFEAAGVGGGRNVEDSPVNLPRRPGVSLRTVLRHLVAQVGGAYLIRKDHIEITTHDRQLIEAFGPPPLDESQIAMPTVNAVFEARTLEKALEDLAGQTGKNIVLDPQVEEKQKKFTVSARLLNTPIDAAVLVVADMVGLRPVTIGNVFYITTRDNAQRLLNEGSVKPASAAKPVAPAKPDGK